MQYCAIKFRDKSMIICIKRILSLFVCTQIKNHDSDRQCIFVYNKYLQLKKNIKTSADYMAKVYECKYQGAGR